MLGKVQCGYQVFEEHTCAGYPPWINSTASCWLTRPLGKWQNLSMRASSIYLMGQQLKLWTLISMGNESLATDQGGWAELFQEVEELLPPGHRKWFRVLAEVPNHRTDEYFTTKQEVCQLKAGKDAKDLGGPSGLRHISTLTSTPGG